MTTPTNTITGSNGFDFVRGSEINDIFDGLGGINIFYGYGGDDVATGGDNGNGFYMGDGDDVAITGDGHDILNGGDGDDWLSAGGGIDSLTGGEGADTFVITSDSFGVDTINDFQIGVDTIDLSAFDLSFADLNLQATSQGTEFTVGDNRVVLKNVNPNDLSADDFTGLTAAPTVLEGTEGNDIPFHGTSGDDIIHTYGGIDQVLAGDGNDWVDGGDGGGSLDGGAGNDTLLGGSGRDTLRGGDGEDVLTGGGDRDTLWGGDGADAFVFTDNSWDTVKDFEVGVDVLDFSALGLEYDDLTFIEDASALVIDTGAAHIQLDGIDLNSGLSESDFIF